jgi:hypothetical protein
VGCSDLPPSRLAVRFDQLGSSLVFVAWQRLPGDARRLRVASVLRPVLLASFVCAYVRCCYVCLCALLRLLYALLRVGHTNSYGPGRVTRQRQKLA